MQDDRGSQALPGQIQPETQPKTQGGRRRGSITGIVLTALLSFLLGGMLVCWLIWDGSIRLPFGNAEPAAAVVEAPAVATPPPAASNAEQTQNALEIRIAELEQRLTRLDLQAEAASGNAARAEGMLFAYAARRLVDRGAPLGYLEQQLKLRFSDAQPNAVDIIIAAGRQPITLDQLSAQLDLLSPDLLDMPVETSSWDKFRSKLSNIFVIRRTTTPSPLPGKRLERAKMLLQSGKVDAAIGEVERLPGAASAATWVADARRYAAVQNALDLLETTAMLEPRRLKDSDGEPVEQKSPLAEPATEATGEATATPEV